MSDAETADRILKCDPVEPAVSEIASRVVGIVGDGQPGAVAHLSDRMDEVVRAEVRLAIESSLDKARKIVEDAQQRDSLQDRDAQDLCSS